MFAIDESLVIRCMRAEAQARIACINVPVDRDAYDLASSFALLPAT